MEHMGISLPLSSLHLYPSIGFNLSPDSNLWSLSSACMLTGVPKWDASCQTIFMIV